MPTITPNLWFDGRAEEAARFYASVFPGSEIESVSRAAADNPSTKEGDVLLVTFTLSGQRFVGINGGPQFPFTEAVSFQIDCEDQAEVDRYWDALVEGGGEHGQCGWLKDRFGLSWQVVPKEMRAYVGGPDPDGSRRAMEAMLQMSKLDVGALRRAYDGVETGARTQADAAARVREDQRFWRAIVAEVGRDRMEEPGPMGEWTFRDLVGHLAGWRRRMVDRLEAAVRGEPEPAAPWPSDLQDDDAINLWIREQDRGRSLDELLTEYDESFEWVARAIEALPQDVATDPAAFPWMEGAVVDADFTGHLHEEHLPAIRAWLATR